MKKGIFLIIFFFAFSFFSNGAEKVKISVRPDKILYSPGQTAHFKIDVVNNGEEFTGNLKVFVIWEMEDTEKVLDRDVKILKGKNEISAEWKTKEVLGCEVKAILKNKGTVIGTGRDYFNVCRDEDALRVGIHVEYPTLDTFPDKGYLNRIPKFILSLRDGYGNVMEQFGWCPDDFAELAPKRDIWVSAYWQSKVALKKIVEECHKYGMKVLHYAAGYGWNRPGAELLRKHPEWGTYRSTGQIYSGGTINVQKLDWEKNPDKRAGRKFMGGGAQGLVLNFWRKDTLDYGIKQLIESKKMFGWDGVRFDGHFVVWSTVFRDLHTIDGKNFPPPEKARMLTAKNTEYTKRKVKEVFPDYLFMFNGAAFNYDTGKVNIDCIAQCKEGGATANEPIRESSNTTSRWHKWKDFKNLLIKDGDICRENGGYAYAYMNPPWEVCPNVDKISYPILFASNNHPWFAFPNLDRKTDKGGSHYPIQKNLFAFATRFSSILWGYNIERIKNPENFISVSGESGNIWWEDFVYLRKLKDGREYLTIHLINEPPTQNIEPEDQPLPEPIKNVKISVKKNIKKVWAAYPEGVNYFKVPFKNGVINVPGLKIWAIVIVEIGG